MLRANSESFRGRVFRSSRQPSAKLHVPIERPPRYKQWGEEQLAKAFKEVKEGRLSVRRAAELYNVPKSTLSDRVSGRVEFGSHSGPACYLTDEEEELVNFICGCASMGYAKTKKDILTVVEEIGASKGRQVHVSNGWWEAFKQRHPYLALRTVEKLSYARVVASDPVVIDRYYDLLEETLTENGLLDCPSQIFNCDETGLPLDHTPSSVVQ